MGDLEGGTTGRIGSEDLIRGEVACAFDDLVSTLLEALPMIVFNLALSMQNKP
jgi:hypothetical protein